MRLTRRRTTDAQDAELYPALVHVLVDGWQTDWTPAGDGPDRVLDVFGLTDQDFIGIYARHEAVIDAEAHRRGRREPAIAASIRFWRTVGRTDLRFTPERER